MKYDTVSLFPCALFCVCYFTYIVQEVSKMKSIYFILSAFILGVCWLSASIYLVHDLMLCLFGLLFVFFGLFLTLEKCKVL